MGFVKDNYVTSGASGNVGTLWSFRPVICNTILSSGADFNNLALVYGSQDPSKKLTPVITGANFYINIGLMLHF